MERSLFQSLHVFKHAVRYRRSARIYLQQRAVLYPSFEAFQITVSYSLLNLTARHTRRARSTRDA